MKILKSEKRRLDRASLFSFIVVFVFLGIMGILAIVLPKPTTSEFEKRDLTEKPVFSFQSLFAGTYTDQLSLYFADTFPFREHFVIFGSYIKSARGIPYDDVKIYSGGTGAETGPSTSDTPSQSSDSGSSSQSQTSSSSSEPEPVDDGYLNGYNFIYKNMALTPFGGSESAAKYYAATLNKYAQALGDSVQIYNMVVPTHIEFALPEKYKNITSDQKRNIGWIYSSLDPSIKTVDAYSALQAHKDEYIYFNTDHHWTGLGAYYAYTAFADTAGFTPRSLSEFETKTIPNFLGTLYSQTQDIGLKNNPDHVDYFLSDTQYTAYQYRRGEPYTPYQIPLHAEYATGANSYSVYLHGDYPLIKVTTEHKNGRKIMVVKESFGNAFSTFLIENYEEVYIVDLRYFELNAIDFIKENGINELLFINNIFAANTQYHIDCIGNMMYQ